MTDKLKKGYLNENFQLFHIRDQKNIEFEYHYHDFKKIIIFLAGRVTYLIEGKAYFLKPWDILLVNNDVNHKPVIDSAVPYERIVIWINPEFIGTQNNELEDITTCFRLSDKRSFNMIRLESGLQNQLQRLVNELEGAVKSQEFASGILSNALFLQLMVYINRIFLEEQYVVDKTALKYDEQIERILKYINEHLKEELSNDKIAEYFFVSKYYLMHKFKAETGYTLHNYILQKRLFLAKHMIRKGAAVVKTSEECGFKDYSTFLRAYKKLFGYSPKAELNKKKQKERFKIEEESL
jgi:AraC-like DNA-binding protein/mannose-6-phosphate isomerase-like protein (cupin superfamily)